MTRLFDLLKPEARDDLIRDQVIELVTVIVRAVPDPDRPDDRFAMAVTADVYDEFATGIPAIDTAMAQAREICATAGRDISESFRDALLVALNRRRRELDGLREGKIGGQPVAYLSDPAIAELLGPMIRDAAVEVPVWSLAWTVAMEDDGKLLVGAEDSLPRPGPAAAAGNPGYAVFWPEDWDRGTRDSVRLRIRMVDDAVDRIVSGCTDVRRPYQGQNF